MKIVAIVQARMGSHRLPGKMMMDLNGKPVIQCVFDRIKPSRLINELWLATTYNEMDDILVEWAIKNNINYYRGSVDDVLDRFFQTAVKAKADIIVRITGDCPIHDYEVIDKVVQEHLNAVNIDYTSNNHPPTYPDGLDVEVFSLDALKKTWQEAKLHSDREHVTPYIWENLKKFNIKNVSDINNNSDLRWTLDTKEDLKFIRLIVAELVTLNSHCNLNSILEIVKKNPEWQKINAGFERNLGYKKTLKQDRNNES